MSRILVFDLGWPSKPVETNNSDFSSWSYFSIIYELSGKVPRPEDYHTYKRVSMTHFPFVSPHGSWCLSNWQKAKSKYVIKAKDYRRISRDIPAAEKWALVAFFHSPRNPPGGLKLIWKKITHGAASILHTSTLLLGLNDLFEIVLYLFVMDIHCFYAYKTNLQSF